VKALWLQGVDTDFLSGRVCSFAVFPEPIQATEKSNEKRGFAAMQQAVLSTCHNLHDRLVA
jgi:hypothetical protein